MKLICTLLFTFFIGVLSKPQIITDRLNVIDELGNVHFGYNDGQTARHEMRTKDGIVRGTYLFVDANGEIQRVSYTSDPVNGYKIVNESSNIESSTPVPSTETTTPSLTTEVATPSLSSDLDDIKLPTPVSDTPEVVAAKKAHSEAFRLASLRI